MQKHGKPLIITAPAIALLATLMSALPGWAAERVPSQRPQLVLNIVVDGLRSDYLELLADYFGDDGFNKLLKQGVVLEQVEYGPGLDAAGAAATLMTGAEPAVTGIATSMTYSTERRLDSPTLLDAEKLGNYTTETLSPAAIRVSTLADELRIDGGGTGYAHAIAADATRAIVLGGHAGNSAFWINDVNGNWATTTHYREVPTAISARNYTSPLSLRIDTISWTPSMAMADYPALPSHKKLYPFHHTFAGNAADKYTQFKLSAPANREVTDLAEEYIRSMSLGGRDAMDMLSVGYTLTMDSHLELMDAYLKLDREVARLLRAAEASGRTMVLLAGTPGAPSGEADDPRWLLPVGEFSSRRAVSLLNMYLIAKHGNGEWVTAYNRGGFYLNRALIEEKNLNAEDLRADAAKFLMRMTGVAGAYTIDDILEGRTTAARRRNTIVATAADVYLDVIPGWTLIDDFANPATPQKHTVRMAPAVAPAVIYYPPQVEAQRIASPVDARAIAPTVSRILRIRSPNAAAQPPIVI